MDAEQQDVAFWLSLLMYLFSLNIVLIPFPPSVLKGTAEKMDFAMMCCELSGWLKVLTQTLKKKNLSPNPTCLSLKVAPHQVTVTLDSQLLSVVMLQLSLLVYTCSGKFLLRLGQKHAHPCLPCQEVSRGSGEQRCNVVLPMRKTFSSF